MFKMLEVVGTSPESFSKAVQKGVTEIINSGESVHFFEVIEQRGAVRDNEFKEFQVKLKVAVEAKKEKPEKVEHICPTCHQPTSEKGHMCTPVTSDDQECEWCGAMIPDERHLCDDKIKELSYICNSCGRTAVSPEYLCNPSKIS